ncbi:hypothetical protein GCM10011320_48080 [Neoroseomonas lacus]|uniref:Uncharacterized protein n=1 Tax=Neoroseomonas lacus TaxID=287609 RepID=A0A917KYV7_9PROT|nr:hypothetical protein GCM10011320_48080 [Neoroseomonas lacus]
MQRRLVRRLMPTAECFDRWHPPHQALGHRAQTAGLPGFREIAGGPHPALTASCCRTAGRAWASAAAAHRNDPTDAFETGFSGAPDLLQVVQIAHGGDVAGSRAGHERLIQLAQ